MNSKSTIKKVLPQLKNVLIIGSGGRENALAWAIKASKGIEKVFVAPGNGGTEEQQGCYLLDIKETDIAKIIESCHALQIGLVVIGPEAPLASGLADKLRSNGLTVFGPGKEGAQLEASKQWAKELMKEAGVSTAKYWSVKTIDEALGVVKRANKPLVVKANGLASGKGVTVPSSIEECQKAIKEVFEGKFGDSGNTVVLEECLQGPEVSVFALCDGEQMVILPPAQDHKRLREGDNGPNTGGMGAYAPAPILSSEQLKQIKEKILEPTLNTLKKRGINYRGVIYAGLMLTPSGAYVIEFNCRFGDPECQALMPLLGNEIAQVLQACALGCLEQSPKLSIKEGCSACVVAAASGYPEKPRNGDLIKIKVESNKLIQVFHAGTKLNQQGNLITSGGRVLCVVAKETSFERAFSIAYENMNQIYFEGITFRKDIGYQVRRDLKNKKQ
tara:strand:+ start:882 stop:2216 length:1335 start_codon:yes stop_codon:yes gene_type:complete